MLPGDLLVEKQSIRVPELLIRLSGLQKFNEINRGERMQALEHCNQDLVVYATAHGKPMELLQCRGDMLAGWHS